MLFSRIYAIFGLVLCDSIFCQIEQNSVLYLNYEEMDKQQKQELVQSYVKELLKPLG